MTNVEYNMPDFDLPTCEVLREHWDKLARTKITKALKQNGGNSNLSDLAKIEQGKALDAIESQENIGVYNKAMARILSTHKIPIAKQKLLLNALEKSATVYVKSCVQKSAHQLIQNEISNLANISEQAKQLALNLDALNNPDSLLVFLSRKAPAILDEIDLQKLIDDNQPSLRALINLEEKLQNSEYFQALRIGKPGRKRDWQLHMWVMFMLEIWITLLGRIPNNSQDKMNGRQRFLEFICDCMEPLHPDLEQDKIINVYNRIQKEA